MSAAGEPQAEPRPEGRGAARFAGRRHSGVSQPSDCKEADV